MANVLESLTAGISAFGGGSGVVDEVALSAKAAQVQDRLRTDMLNRLRVVGSRISGFSNFLGALADGAKQSDKQRALSKQTQYFGVNSNDVSQWGLLGGLAVAGLVLWMVVR